MVQVTQQHYEFDTYITLPRWMSYWHQMNAVARTRARSILELGCGTGVMTRCLRENIGLDVKTFDFDAALKPDVIGDVRNIGEHFAPKSFDCVCAFQVLEHVPYDDFERTLPQLAKVTRGHLLISLPHWGYFVECRVRIWKERWVGAFARKLTRPYNWNFNGEHYWELGTRGYSISRVQRSLERWFVVERNYFCPDNSYHYFFECIPRN